MHVAATHRVATSHPAGVLPVSKLLTTGRVRLFAAIAGILLILYLVQRTGPANIAASFRTLGWGIVLIIALGGVSHVVKTWAWRLTLLDQKHKMSFARLFGSRLACEAAGQLGLMGQVFGDSLRLSHLHSTMPLAGRITSVALDRALFVLSTIVVTIAGLV